MDFGPSAWRNRMSGDPEIRRSSGARRVRRATAGPSSNAAARSCYLAGADFFRVLRRRT
jgi:hypothetical protein